MNKRKYEEQRREFEQAVIGPAEVPPWILPTQKKKTNHQMIHILNYSTTPHVATLALAG